VQGAIGAGWTAWFVGAALEQLAGISTIDTTVDQAALRGLLCRLWDLNLIVMSVNRAEADALATGGTPNDEPREGIQRTDNGAARSGWRGGSLARMYQAGFPVPDGFVILPSAFADDDLTPEAWAQIQAQLAQQRAANHNGAFAVRSSALSEDSAQASFAGEFETVLNVHTATEIRSAIDTVYHSRHSERVQAYSQVKGLAAAHEIAVVVQQLVCADCAGVMFTANPITGQRDQIVINAAWGLGEAIVSGRVTPDTLTVDKATGRILKRETADKQVMTVLVEHHTEERPVPEDRRHALVLSDVEADELAQWGVRIEQFYGRPMDIEWARAGKQFAIVQARPITALPEPEPPGPTNWQLPKGSYAAMRNNIVELMIEPLTPLFDTLGRSCINASLGRQLTQFMGSPDVMPQEFIISVNGFAYNNGSLSLRGLVYVLLHSAGILKRMFRGAADRWQVARPRYVATVERWQSTPWRDRSGAEILIGVRELAEAAIDAYGALVSGIIPGAWISEALFTFVYKLIRRHDDPSAPTYLLGYNSLPIQGEKALYDLAVWARSQNTLAAHLIRTPATQLAAQLDGGEAPAGVNGDEWHAWQTRCKAYLQCYGHTIYNLDFATPVPADDPAPLLETCKMFITDQAQSVRAAAGGGRSA
jgi:pyruvate,water dikinase